MSFDPVTKPAHYNLGGIECLDALEASMTEDEFLGYLKGNVFKYLWRWRHKGKPVEDLGKAQFYLNLLSERAKTRQEQLDKVLTPKPQLNLFQMPVMPAPVVMPNGIHRPGDGAFAVGA